MTDTKEEKPKAAPKMNKDGFEPGSDVSFSDMMKARKVAKPAKGEK